MNDKITGKAITLPTTEPKTDVPTAEEIKDAQGLLKRAGGDLLGLFEPRENL